MRETFQCNVQNSSILGTYHTPKKKIQDKVSGQKRTPGFIFFNMGNAPRACHGNLLARIADDLADLSFPVFRFDLPGLGDSPGESPYQEEPLWRFFLGGGYTQHVCDVISYISEHYHIEKFIIGGLCGGAGASIYVADALPDSIIGSMLFELDMNIPALRRDRNAGNDKAWSTQTFVGRKEIVKEKASSLKSWFRFLTGQSQYRDHFKTLYSHVLNKINQLKKQKLPLDSNFKMIKAWKKLVKSDRPALLIFSGGDSSEIIYKNIMEIELPNRTTAHQVVEHSITKTNHTFTTQGADIEVIDLMKKWVKKNFSDSSY